MDVCGQRQSPAGKLQHQMYMRLDGPQGRAGRVRKTSPPPGFDPRTVQSVATEISWPTLYILIIYLLFIYYFITFISTNYYQYFDLTIKRPR